MKAIKLYLPFCFLFALTLLLIKPSDSKAQRSFERGVKIIANSIPINVGIGHAVPAVGDWNNDGKKDLIVGQFKNGHINLLLNTGTDKKPVFGEPELLTAGGKPISLPAG